MTIKINVVDKRASLVGAPFIVCGNSDYSIEFAFDAEWDNAPIKTARFVYIQNGAMKHQEVVFSGNVAKVPVLSNIRAVQVGVYAGDLRTTTPATISCQRSILCGSSTHEDPEPDVYNQLLDLINAGLIRDEWIQDSVNVWLSEHPEATTTVQDGSITEAKLHDSLARNLLASMIVSEASGEVITSTDASNGMIQGLTLYGKTTQDGTPTPESPVELESVGASGNIGVTVLGKNLFDESLLLKAAGWSETNGEYIGVIGPLESVYGSNTNGFETLSFLPNTQYTISLYGYVESYSSQQPRFVVKYTDGTTSLLSIYTGTMEYKTLTTDAGKSIEKFYFTYSSTGNLHIKNMQIELGTVATPYEPYTSQTLTAQTPNGLPGIPVSSGGNYTDESGQQWICDEVDFAKGVYVQRIEVADMGKLQWAVYGDSGAFCATKPVYPLSDNYIMCEKYPFMDASALSIIQKTDFGAGLRNSSGIQYIIVKDKNNSTDVVAFTESVQGMRLQYALATPIETPLSPEELAQYAALHTNKPNTTVFNDANAYMKLEYVADPKNYIDQKIAAISAALLNA